MQVDLDLGNYERFLDITLTRDNNLTTGKIYQAGGRRIAWASMLVHHDSETPGSWLMRVPGLCSTSKRRA